MIQPPAAMSVELKDSCPSCTQYCEPIVVDNNADNPTAAYHCNTGHVWFAEWRRSYAKVTNDPPLPSPTPSAASKTLLQDPPKCNLCGYPQGQGHALDCPYNTLGSQTPIAST